MTTSLDQRERAIRIVAELLEASGLIKPTDVDRRIGGHRVEAMVELVETYLLRTVVQTMVHYVEADAVDAELAALGLRRIELDD